MASDCEYRLAFAGEWFQEEAAMVRHFLIYFFPEDSAVEIFDQRSRKMFLKRTRIKELSERDFFIGAKLNIFGRQFEILDYGDSFTRNKLGKLLKKTVLLLKGTIIHEMGRLLTVLTENGFSVCNGRMVQFTKEGVIKFFSGSKMGDVALIALINQLISMPTIGFEFIGDNALERLKMCAGANGELAAEYKSSSLSALLQEENIQKGIHFSENDEDAERESNFFFNTASGLTTTIALHGSTLAILKPHVIKEGKVGHIITEILNIGFKITALKMIRMDRVNCEEFYEVYRGVLPEYIQMVAHLASGVSMAIEIVFTDESKNAHAEFRKLCGPMDPEIARQLRPHTLRAKYGKDKIQNAVHCTDLPEDSRLEIEYIFKILD